jgi:hypothetical protein
MTERHQDFVSVTFSLSSPVSQGLFLSVADKLPHIGFVFIESGESVLQTSNSALRRRIASQPEFPEAFLTLSLRDLRSRLKR